MLNKRENSAVFFICLSNENNKKYIRNCIAGICGKVSIGKVTLYITLRLLYNEFISKGKVAPSEG